MFAVEMLFYQQRIHGQFRIDGISNACHLSHLFHYHCIVYSIVSSSFPQEKWAVIFYQVLPACVQVQPSKRFTITFPVSISYAPSTSSFVISAVQGMASWK